MEETDTSTVVSKLIENETYYFDDVVFTVNGIQLTVHSITLHREDKPEGYSLEVAYSLQNQRRKVEEDNKNARTGQRQK